MNEPLWDSRRITPEVGVIRERSPTRRTGTVSQLHSRRTLSEVAICPLHKAGFHDGESFSLVFA
jgi:hypothetical protein